MKKQRTIVGVFGRPREAFGSGRLLVHVGLPDPGTRFERLQGWNEPRGTDRFSASHRQIDRAVTDDGLRKRGVCTGKGGADDE